MKNKLVDQCFDLEDAYLMSSIISSWIFNNKGMKKLSSFIILILSIQYAISAQNKQPKLTVEVSTHDFGDIYQGDKVSDTFKFKNVGYILLLITNVSTSCGCTAPILVKRSCSARHRRLHRNYFYECWKNGQTTYNYNH